VLALVLAYGLVLPPDHRALRVIDGESWGGGGWCQISILTPMEDAEIGMTRVSDDAFCAALAARGGGVFVAALDLHAYESDFECFQGETYAGCLPPHVDYVATRVIATPARDRDDALRQFYARILANLFTP
jgi:hypothetical protein